jgi:hypothetical protein
MTVYARVMCHIFCLLRSWLCLASPIVAVLGLTNRGCAWPHPSWLCLASPIVAVLGLTHRGCAWPHQSWLCLASPIVAVLGFQMAKGPCSRVRQITFSACPQMVLRELRTCVPSSLFHMHLCKLL